MSRNPPEIAPPARENDADEAAAPAPVSSPAVEALIEAVLAFALGKPTKHALVVGGFGAGKSYALDRATEVARKGELRVAQLARGPLGISSYADFLFEVAKATRPMLVERAEIDAWRVDLLQAGKDLKNQFGANEVTKSDRAAAVAERVREIEARVIDGAGSLVLVVESLDQLLYQVRSTDRPWLVSLLKRANSNLLILGSAHGSGLVAELGEWVDFVQAAYLTDLPDGLAFAVQEARRLGWEDARVPERMSRNAEHLDPATRTNWLFWRLVGRYLVLARRDVLGWAEEDLGSRAASHFDAMLLTLAPSEQRILLALAEAGGPRTVDALAGAVGVRNQAAATALGRLFLDDWVAKVADPSNPARPDGRRTWYDIADPMLRVHLQEPTSRE